jgi:hypothetical protein
MVKIGNKTETELGQRVVLDLVSGIEGKNHIVFMDNYFSSHELFKKLKERNIFACGTVNPTRKGLPKLKEEKYINRGDFDFIVSNDRVCVCTDGKTKKE